MKFISPTIDYVFKKIFGSDRSEALLISLLNGIIYDGKKVIKSLKIIPPSNRGQSLLLRDNYLDVRAILYDGTQVIIEIQVATMTAFDKSVVFNLSKAHANQLEKGRDYASLKPVISVTITDFMMFKETQKVVTKFAFKEEEEFFNYKAAELRLIFVELPKFKKTLSELKGLTDKWIYFFKETAQLNGIPENLGEVPEIKRALHIANQGNMTAEELEVIERRAILQQDKIGKVTKARDDGGDDGRIMEAIALLMRLLQKRFGKIPTEISSQIKELSIEDLESLGEALFHCNNLEDLSVLLGEERKKNEDVI